MPIPEAELISRSRRGDSEAFGRLIRRYEDKIFRLAYHVCAGLPSEAEDVYQETFLSAFKKISRFRGGANLGTWLYRIAANLCWTRFRRRKREGFSAVLDLPDKDGRVPRRQPSERSPTPEEAARKKELRETVLKALSELPVDYRLVLVLRDIENLSGEETAAALKLSLPAVKSRLHRGRLFLKDRLDAYMAGEKR